jgi:hypothetical protein
VTAFHHRFLELGLILTSYPDGSVRLSLSEEIRFRDVDRFRKALRRVSLGTGRVISGWCKEG